MQKTNDKADLDGSVRKRIESVIKVKASFQNVVAVATKHGVVLPKGLADTLGDIESEYRVLLDRLERKLRIAVAGKFSCGKSQFINSLIEKEIASVDSARTTCCKTIFTGDPSVSEVVISDSEGRTYSREEYVQRSSKVSAGREVFTVRLPDADWKAFEVIDTPGYDSIDEGDLQISEEAVADADVVFFLFDMSNGTIPKDSIEYLKRSVRANQLVYLVANKADLKPDGARRMIMDSIASECKGNKLRYESILPYSSLMPWSKEILEKNDVARTSVLKIARQLKTETLNVVNKLLERAIEIRDARIRVELKAVDGSLDDFQRRVDQLFGAGLASVLSKESESRQARYETLLESIISILEDSAVEKTGFLATRFVRWHELKGTHWFGNDWAVYLARPTTEYDLSGLDELSLTKLLLRKFSECGFSVPWLVGLAKELIALRKECAIKVIDKFRIKDGDSPSTNDASFFYNAAFYHGDFCKICRRKSERMAQEKSILANLNSVFPKAFVELLTEKVERLIKRNLLAESFAPTENATGKSAKALADFDDSCAETLNAPMRGCAAVVENLTTKGSSPNGIVEEIVSTVEGVVEALYAESGNAVKQGERLLSVNVLNMHWPIIAVQDGWVEFKVKFGEHVKRGDVLAVIS